MTQFQYFSTDHESYPSTVTFIFTFTAALRTANFSVLNTRSFGCYIQDETVAVLYSTMLIANNE